MTATAAIPERIPLEGAWRLTQAQRKISIPAMVPGVAQTDLLAAHKIPDPFYRDNEKAVHWVGEVPWTYARTFTLSPAFVKHRRILLRCEGLDTLGHITVNGKRVADTDNMFRTWEFDVRPLLHAGVNTIAVSFDPVEPYLKAHENQAAFPGKPMSGWGYIRKAPFQQGWDFAPKIITCGIWRGIGLIGWDHARLTDVKIAQDLGKPGRADLTVNVAADSRAAASARTVVSFHERIVAQAVMPLRGGKGAASVTIPRPQLWWPAGMGAQNLYDVRVTLLDTRGGTLDTAAKSIGLRTIAWIPKTNKHPLTLAVNGRPFFAKGTNWVPNDSLITRTTAEKERRFVDNAVEANVNFVRLWGGGYYEDEAFYNECDRKGLLCWFEFKFADAAYPIFDPAWLANVKAEAEDNVRRLRHHPSIAVWSGNNECIGFVADKTDAGHMSREDYNTLFHRVLPDTVCGLAPGAVNSDTLKGDAEADFSKWQSVYTPGSPESGDEHDWSVWHGGSAFESYRDVHGFMSEFGFQAFPQPKTAASYTNAADRATVLTEVMRYHQRNWGSGNQMIVNTLNRYYRKPKDFETTLWLSQIQQSDGVLTGVEHWRRDWPNSTGSLVWQYNDCWPGTSWAMVDYCGRPKALWYRLRHAYAPVMLSGQADGKSGSAELWISNDRAKALMGRLDWTLMRMNGSVVTKGSKAVAIPPGESSVKALALSQKATIAKEGSGNLLLWSRLSVPGEPASTAVLTYARPKFLNLAAPAIETSVAQEGASYRVTLTAARPALRVWLDLTEIDARYSDNFVDLRPGEPVTIMVTPAAKTSPAQFKAALKTRSLYDTYSQQEDQSLIVKPLADGSVVATAEMAEIDANAAYLEDFTPRNIGNWSNVNDNLLWTLKGVTPGTYHVIVNLSCPSGEEGSRYTIDIAGAKVSGVVPSTGAWTTYVDVDLGTVAIARTGKIAMTLTPTSKPSTHVMNLRSVTLRPATPE
jgi:beta-mannosidase